jgi:hypothetical protein
MSAKTGGPAFPYSFPDGRKDDYNVAYGMTLRDYFAAKAMHAALMTVKPQKGNTMDDVVTHAATTAYLISDAMLKARES